MNKLHIRLYTDLQYLNKKYSPECGFKKKKKS